MLPSNMPQKMKVINCLKASHVNDWDVIHMHR